MIEFTRRAHDVVVDHARRGAPAEVCGVLAGRRADEAVDRDRADDVVDRNRADDAIDRDRGVVLEARPTDNVADRPETRYRIDPEELFAVVESIEDDGLEVVGFYHSHPAGPAEPSGTDVARATWVDHSYVICALDGHPFVGSWRWRGDDEGFEPETVALRDDRTGTRS
ncbi:desampylase [Halorubrum sp. F4]|uniref:desampylase n=1 Tax=Halorubrum sp. F4 TaxID=2989715 RepID=UPI002480ACF6|nr:desampylase [Halorubrum sp. F4]